MLNRSQVSVNDQGRTEISSEQKEEEEKILQLYYDFEQSKQKIDGEKLSEEEKQKLYNQFIEEYYTYSYRAEEIKETREMTKRIQDQRM